MDKKSSANKKQKDAEKLDLTYLKPIGRIVLIFFVGLSFYLFVSSIVLLFLTQPDKEVKVPSVVGKQFGDVYNNLVKKGLKPEIKFQDVSDLDNGQIMEQYPSSGDIVYEGSTLKLVVSRSSLIIDMPNLIGIELPFARNKLKNLHSYNRSVSLQAGVISFIPSEKTAENIVIDQSPRAGERITPDRKINLLVSAGRAEGEMLMPGVTGQSIDLCFDLLLAKGLYVDQSVSETDVPEKSGIIEVQTPEKNGAVTRSDTVRLKVAYFKLQDHPYRAYERIQYEIDRDDKGGLYEAYVEDNDPKRIVYSRIMKPGQEIDFIFHRSGNARLSIVFNKKVVKVIKIDVEELD